MKKKLISTLAICSMVCAFGAGFSLVEANADDFSNVANAIKPLAGASVRLDMENTAYNGIRFQAMLEKSVYENLENSESQTRSVDYGMIIAPLDYEATYGAFTQEALFGSARKYYIEGVTEAGEGLARLGGGYLATLAECEADESKMILSSALVNIDNSQLTREFVAVPYICITDNGVAEYYVANYNEARSMVYVAQRVINNENSGLSSDEIEFLTNNYVNFKDEEAGIDVASKKYTYTVEHIATDSLGNEIEVFERYAGEKTTLGTTVSAEANEYTDYEYDATLSNASDIIYANNRTTLKLYYKLGIPMTPHLKQYNGQLAAGMSLEKQTEGEFAGAYKYVNGQLGRAGTHNDKYGQLGIFFDEVFNANLGYAEGAQRFFDAGYKYIKFDFYAEPSVYSLEFRHGDSVAQGWLQELKAGSTFTSNVFAFYDANGEKVNKWTVGEWYTVVIKPTKTTLLCLQTNAQTATSETPVMYVKNLAYRSENPFPLTPTMVVNTTKASLTKETTGEFAGAYNYTNTSLGTVGGQYGEAGLYFNEIFPITDGHVTTFHDEGYQYVELDFYATETVYSISFSENWFTASDRMYTLTAGSTLAENDVFALYNEDGAKVNKWTVGAWYTLVIKPHVAAKGNYDYPLRIQTNAQAAGAAAPVMYIKNVSYETEAFQSVGEVANLAVRANKASFANVAYQTTGEFANTWKFTNVSNKAGSQQTETQCGFMFDQLQKGDGTRIKTFFENGYQYISLQFYVATSTVDSIDFRHGLKTDRYFVNGTAREQYNGNIFTIYDANGQVATTLTAGAWYTLVIIPQAETDGVSAGIYINLRETNAAEESPVMYIKNPTYLVNAPVIG